MIPLTGKQENKDVQHWFMKTTIHEVSIKCKIILIKTYAVSVNTNMIQ